VVPSGERGNAVMPGDLWDMTTKLGKLQYGGWGVDIGRPHGGNGFGGGGGMWED
jgi:hypothetical protein